MVSCQMSSLHLIYVQQNIRSSHFLIKTFILDILQFSKAHSWSLKLIKEIKKNYSPRLWIRKTYRWRHSAMIRSYNNLLAAQRSSIELTLNKVKYSKAYSFHVFHFSICSKYCQSFQTEWLNVQGAATFLQWVTCFHVFFEPASSL